MAATAICYCTCVHMVHAVGHNVFLCLHCHCVQHCAVEYALLSAVSSSFIDWRDWNLIFCVIFTDQGEAMVIHCTTSSWKNSPCCKLFFNWLKRPLSLKQIWHLYYFYIQNSPGLLWFPLAEPTTGNILHGIPKTSNPTMQFQRVVSLDSGINRGCTGVDLRLKLLWSC